MGGRICDALDAWGAVAEKSLNENVCAVKKLEEETHNELSGVF